MVYEPQANVKIDVASMTSGMTPSNPDGAKGKCFATLSIGAPAAVNARLASRIRGMAKAPVGEVWSFVVVIRVRGRTERGSADARRSATDVKAGVAP
jgi:hypothetical protein